jgi:RecA/RadA recombinase
MAKKAKGEKSEEEVENTPFTQILDIIAAHKHEHYGVLSGDELDAYRDEIISTGSARFDARLGGGFRPGMSLFFGDEEAGKTAQGLGWGKQWQKKYGEKGWVVYYDAEGRMTEYKLKQSGVDTSRFIWVRGNTGEDIFDQIDKLVCNNKLGIKYFFIIDSLDAIITKEGKAKGFSDPQKVAGGAAMQSLAGKKLSNPIHGLGHHLYMVSQMRTQKIGGGGPEAPKPSGGKAPRFYADIIGRIYKGYSETYIKKGDSIIGNVTKIKLTKSYNETSGEEIDIPIKHKLVGGIWREYEAYMMCQEWGWIDKKGAWFSFSEIFQKFLEDDKTGIDLSEVKLQGETNFVEFFEKSPNLVKYMEAKMLSLAV